MPVTTSTLALRSPAFASGGEIPGRHTCDGADLAPPLEWSGAPPGTRSFALIVEDPDAPDPTAPKVTWVHWVVYDLPAGTTSLPEGRALPPGAREGLNDWMRTGWGGPCPPIGRHRYFFRLFALDQPLGSLGRPAAAKLHGVMRDHVLARAELMGTYERRK